MDTLQEPPVKRGLIEIASGFIVGLTTYLGTVSLLVTAATTLIGLIVVLANRANLPRCTVWLFAAFAGLPLLTAFVTKTIPDWSAWIRKGNAVRLPPEAASPVFQIGPRDDPDTFSRVDNRHVEILDWIRETREPILFLTGRSGTGKSSVLEAWVIPKLAEAQPAVHVLSVRSYDDPVESLRKALLDGDFLGSKPGATIQVRTLLERVGGHLASKSERLLLIFDQFEELVILHGQSPDRVQGMADLLLTLREKPIHGLTVLLSLRIDYAGILHKLGLPALHEVTNWSDVAAFEEPEAAAFLKSGFEELGERRLKSLLVELRAIEDSPGLIRPIVLNLGGLVLTRGLGLAAGAGKPGALISGYVRGCVERGSLRDHASEILKPMLTEHGTKRPRSVKELIADTSLDADTIEGYLAQMVPMGLARRITRPDAVECRVWEISHDFVARLLHLVLNHPRRSAGQLLRPWFMPAALVLWLIVILGVLPYEIKRRDLVAKGDVFADLGSQGFSIEERRDAKLFIVKGPHDLESLDKVVPELKKLGRSGSLELVLSGLYIMDLSPLSGLIELQALDLTGAKAVDDLKPLKNLTRLQTLNLSGTGVEDLKPLKNLTKLQTLNLSGTSVSDLSPLSSLIELQTLDLTDFHGSDLSPLSGLTSLQSLDLTGATWVQDLKPLVCLTKLRTLNLGRTMVWDLSPLSGLTSLQSLDLSFTQMPDLKPLAGLKKLRSLNLADVQYTGDLSYIKPHGSRFIVDLKPLAGLTELQMLILNGASELSDLSPLVGLIKLNTLGINHTNVKDLSPLSGLPELRSLDITTMVGMPKEQIRAFMEKHPHAQLQYIGR